MAYTFVREESAAKGDGHECKNRALWTFPYGGGCKNAGRKASGKPEGAAKS